MKSFGSSVGAEGRHQHLLTKWWWCTRASPVYVSAPASPLQGILVLFSVLGKDVFLLDDFH